jgi:hypothetical protein
VVDLNDPKKSSTTIFAHNSCLSCLAISGDGKKVASASEKVKILIISDKGHID